MNGDLKADQVDGKGFQRVLSLIFLVLRNLGENRVVLKTSSPPLASSKSLRVINCKEIVKSL